MLRGPHGVLEMDPGHLHAKQASYPLYCPFDPSLGKSNVLNLLFNTLISTRIVLCLQEVLKKLHIFIVQIT